MAVAVDQQIQTPSVRDLQTVKLEEDSHWEQEISLQGNYSGPETSCQSFWHFHYQEASGPREALLQLRKLCCQWLRLEKYKRADPGVAGPRTVADCPSPGDPGLGPTAASREWRGGSGPGERLAERTWKTEAGGEI